MFRPSPQPPNAAVPPEIVSVAIGRWAVARPPVLLRTLLGSCIGVLIFDRQSGVGGLAHVVLPDSRGSTEQPGKYADTAVPALLADLTKLANASPSPHRAGPRFSAKLFGGASMFAVKTPNLDIGRQNQQAVEQALQKSGIPVVARDLGGEAGRRLTCHTQTGVVSVKIPGGDEYDI